MVDDQHSDKKPEGEKRPSVACRCSSNCLGRAALLSAPVDDDATIEPTHGRRACLIINTLRDRSNVIRGDPWRRRPFFDALSQVAHGSPRIFRLVGSWESGDYIER